MNGIAENKKENKVKSGLASIVIDEELWAELRMQAIREKTSASEICRRLIADYLQKTGNTESDPINQGIFDQTFDPTQH